MMLRNSMNSAVVLLLVLAAARTAPAADAAPDTSSPKAAAMALWKATKTGDLAAAKSVCTGTEEQMKMIETMVNLTSSMKKMQAAADAKFGKENALSKMFGAIPDMAGEIGTMEEKVDGDTAVLTSKSAGNRPLKLIKKEGKWLVDVASMDMGPGAEMLEPIVAVTKEVTAGITAGQYTDAAAAMAAFQQKMAAAFMSSPKKTPSTAPTK